MDKVILVLAGGGLGSVTRYGTTLFAVRLLGTAFPWGTLAVNLVGCLLIGMSFALAEQKNVISPAVRLFFMTGFLGGLTTFSTYGLESVNFARTGTPWISLVNLAVNNAGGFALVFVGIWLVRMIF